jgi:hypothetical protein
MFRKSQASKFSQSTPPCKSPGEAESQAPHASLFRATQETKPTNWPPQTDAPFTFTVGSGVAGDGVATPSILGAVVAAPSTVGAGVPGPPLLSPTVGVAVGAAVGEAVGAFVRLEVVDVGGGVTFGGSVGRSTGIGLGVGEGNAKVTGRDEGVGCL